MSLLHFDSFAHWKVSQQLMIEDGRTLVKSVQHLPGFLSGFYLLALILIQPRFQHFNKSLIATPNHNKEQQKTERNARA